MNALALLGTWIPSGADLRSRRVTTGARGGSRPNRKVSDINTHRVKLTRVLESVSSRRDRISRWPQLVVLAAAMAALLLVATGAAFLHQDQPGSTASCPMCYVAHSPALRSALANPVAASLVVVWVVTSVPHRHHAEPELLQSAPRGPPSAPLFS